MRLLRVKRRGVGRGAFRGHYHVTAKNVEGRITGARGVTRGNTVGFIGACERGWVRIRTEITMLERHPRVVTRLMPRSKTIIKVLLVIAIDPTLWAQLQRLRSLAPSEETPKLSFELTPLYYITPSRQQGGGVRKR